MNMTYRQLVYIIINILKLGTSLKKYIIKLSIISYVKYLPTIYFETDQRENNTSEYSIMMTTGIEL